MVVSGRNLITWITFGVDYTPPGLKGEGKSNKESIKEDRDREEEE